MKQLSAVFFVVWFFLANTPNIAQTSDTTPYTLPKNFFKKWRPAGINLSVGTLKATKDFDVMSSFKGMLTTPYGRDKFFWDNHVVSTYPYNLTETKYNYVGTVRLGLTFKPKIINPRKVISYTEFTAGLRYTSHSMERELFAHSGNTDSALFTSYFARYQYSAESFSIDAQFTVQTPGWGIVALYTGPGLYGGVSFHRSTSTSESTIYYADSTTGTTPFYATFLPEHSSFSKATTTFGFFMPIGAKLNISPRSNLFIEYVFTVHGQHFKNGFTFSYPYRGVMLGYRFKLGVKRDKDGRIENGLDADESPEPFY